MAKKKEDTKKKGAKEKDPEKEDNGEKDWKYRTYDKDTF